MPRAKKKAAPRKPEPVPSQRDDLERLRKGLLEAFEAAPDPVKAQIAGQLRMVIKDLAGLGVAEGKGSVADEIAARRAARKPADIAPAGRRSQSRRSSGHHRSG